MRPVLSLGGGQAVKLAEYPSVGHGAWASDNALLVSPTWVGIGRIADQGGPVEYMRSINHARGEFGYFLPSAHPDSPIVAYTVWDGNEGARIDAFDRASGRVATVVESGANGRFARTPRGTYLLWERKGTLFAAPFDDKPLRLGGPEHPLVDGVLTSTAEFESSFDVSDEGTLVYLPGGVFDSEHRLVWVGPDGRRAEVRKEHLPFAEPQLSADGSRLSVILRRRVFVAYVYDLKRGTSDRVTFDADVASGAISPDGEKFVYGSNRDGAYDVWLKTLRDGKEKRLLKGGDDLPHQFTWSADGKYVAFSRSNAQHSAYDIWVLALEPEPRESRFTDAPGQELFPSFSPNGKWIAYAAGEQDAYQIYLRSFPDGAVRRQITTAGGTEPKWSADGKTLFFRKGHTLQAASISPDEGQALGPPRTVYNGRFGQPDEDMPTYAVGPDGRLLLIEPADDGARVPHIEAILGWYRALP